MTERKSLLHKLKDPQLHIGLLVILLLILATLSTHLYLNPRQVQNNSNTHTPSPTSGISEWATFYNSNYRFSFKYPSHLTPQPTAGGLYNDTHFSLTDKKSLQNREISVNIIEAESLSAHLQHLKPKLQGHVTSTINHEEVIEVDGQEAVRLDFDVVTPKKSVPNSLIIIYFNNHSYELAGQPTPLDQILSTFQFLPDTSNWQTYTTDQFSYQHPNNLVRLDNPRNFDQTSDLQYFLINQNLAAQYQECLKTGKQQLEKYRQNSQEAIEWVDWEVACDIGHVAYKLSTSTGQEHVPNPHTSTTPLTTSQGITWQVEEPTWGMGDQTSAYAFTTHKDKTFTVRMTTDARSLGKYLDKELMLQEGNSFDVKPLINEHQKLFNHILSTFKLTN